MIKYTRIVVWLALSIFSASGLLAQDKSTDKQGNTISEVSIIGNTELPNVSFDLPWKLPSVTRREEQKPVARLEGMLDPIEPETHRKRLFFSQHLKLDVPKY